MAPSDGLSIGPPLSLRPVPVGDKKPKVIADFIARVNAEPGGFRAVNSEELRAELRQREERGHNGITLESEESSDEEEGDGSKDINAIRLEVLKNIE